MSDEGLRFKDEDDFVRQFVAAKRLERRTLEQQREDRRHALRTGIVSVLRESLPNAIGTVLGGGFLALIALALGLVDGVDATTWIFVLLVVGAAIGLGTSFWALRILSEKTPFEEDATIRQEASDTYQRWRELGLLTDDDTPS